MTWIHYGTEVPRFGTWPEEEWFTLGQISRWLATQTGGTAREIARLLLDDFKAGKFDGPWKTDWHASEEGDDFVAFPTTGLPAALEVVDLRWRVRWRDEIGRLCWALVDSESAQAGFADRHQIGRRNDPREEVWLADPSDTFWLCKEAVNHWCDWSNYERPRSWPVQDSRSEAWATIEEILRAMERIGSEKKFKIEELSDRVSQLLGKLVSRRKLVEAKKIAVSNGFLSLYGRGNPGKTR